MPIRESIILTALFLWLTFETIWDLRAKDHKIPIWFSLLNAPARTGLVGLFVSPWAALLMAVSIASTEIYPHSLVLGFLGLFGPASGDHIHFSRAHAFGNRLGILVTLWMLRILGGADALAALSLLLFFPTWPMAAAILTGILCWESCLIVVGIVKIRACALDGFDQRGCRNAAGRPGAYALAVLFYGMYHLWVGRH